MQPAKQDRPPNYHYLEFIYNYNKNKYILADFRINLLELSIFAKHEAAGPCRAYLMNPVHD